MTVDWTQIVLALLAIVGGGGWLFDRQKHKAEVERLKADTDDKNFDLSKKYVESFEQQIVQPLKEELTSLKKQVTTLSRTVKKLENAIGKIQDCPHSDGCPVYSELQKQRADDGGPSE